VRRDSAADGSDGFGSPLVRSAAGPSGRISRAPVPAEPLGEAARAGGGGAGGGKSDALHCKTP
jgi:hypothetical protein